MANKKVYKKYKEFTIIPEANRVAGVMMRKHWDEDYGDSSELPYSAYALINEILCDREVNAPNVVKAVAVCDERDEFDEKTGMDVCAAKLEKKNHEWMARNYEYAMNKLQEATKYAYDLWTKHNDKVMAIDSDLERYYGRHHEEDD